MVYLVTGALIAMGALFLLLFLLIYLIVISIKGRQKAKKQMRENKISAQVLLHHVEGLPLSEKTQCQVSVTDTGLVINGGGTDFKIDATQIRATEVKTDTEIANIVKSSAAKGIAGGLLFGPIGLVVGARATSKEKKTNTYYLIINYTNVAGELTALMFDGGNNPFAAQKVANKLRPIIIDNPKQTVQL